MLEVRLFGKFDIQCDGQPVNIRSRVAQALFAYLILNAGTAYRRERLAGMLWPDAPEEKARAYLRYELWRIRKGFPPARDEYLLADDIQISFNASAEYWLDVAAFSRVHAGASIEELTEALSLVQGEFLPAFYEDWVMLERDHLQADYEEKIRCLIDLLEHQKRWPDVLKWAETWISRGVAPEAAYRALIFAYDALGEHAKVASTYERCVEALREMDLEPSEETRALAFRRASRLKIPIPLTSFIGRKQELKDVVELLSTSRLVTLTGSGGVGKTRLSIEVASEVLGQFPDGIWFLDLAPLTDPALVPNTLVELLGLRESGETLLPDLLINYFRSRTALLLFDNCEHLIEASAQLIHLLLASCRNLSILATSREGLRISGEVPYRVPSLEVPRSGTALDMAELSNMEAVRLFVERAAFFSPGFVLNSHNGPAVAQICERLDGIPLAIELAAARVNVLSIAQILQRLDDRFQLLTAGLRSALPRHQTLRATIEWSYDLLSEGERRLFRRLAVFMGDWTLEGAEEVCAGYGIESSSILHLLSQLVNKSLIIAETTSWRGAHDPTTAPLRYHMLETIRQYALEKLRKSREKKRVSARHLEYFLTLVQTAESKLYGQEQLEWLHRLREEHENLRAALEWADQADVEAGLLLSGSLQRFWENIQVFEGSYWQAKILHKPESHNYPRARAKALCTYGWSLVSLQQYAAAHSRAEESLALCRAVGDPAGEVDALLLLAWISSTTAQKRELIQRALDVAESIADVRRQSSALWQLGWLYQGKDSLVYWEKAIALTRSLGNWRGLAGSLSTAGFFLVLNGEAETAQRYLDESNQLYQKLNLSPPPAHLLSAYAQIALLRGDFSKARAYLEESIGINTEFGSRQAYLWARARLGYVALCEGNFAEARQCFYETAHSFREDHYEIGVAYALEGMANLFVSEGKFEQAAALIGWADATREKIGDARPLLEKENIEALIRSITARIGKRAFSREYKSGAVLTLGEALALER